MYIILTEELAYKLIKEEDKIITNIIRLNIKDFYFPLFILENNVSNYLYFYDKNKDMYCVSTSYNIKNYIKIISNKKEKIKVFKIDNNYFYEIFKKYDEMAFNMINKG